MQHQNHSEHWVARSLLRSTCPGWFERCRESRFTSPRVPRQGSSPAYFRLEAASPLKEAFAGPELCDRKLSRTVLRGLDGNNPVRLLGKLSRPVLRALEASNGLQLLGNASRRRSRTPNQLSRVVAKFLVALSGSTIYSAVGLLLAALGGLQWDG